jgi:amidase
MTGTETSAATSGNRALWEMSIRELADGLRAGEFTAQEVTEAHLDRIADCEPKVNALSEVWADAALAQAKQADADRRAGRAAGALLGVPFTVKANIDRQGAATTHGVAALAGNIAPADAPSVAALIRAGAIPLAQTNMPDFAVRWHTESSAHGITVNPWDPAVTTGGSSGGGAVACATGMAPFSLGTDTGGSLRQPAQCCGIASLRPTTGRVADAPALPLTPGLHTLTSQGPMARSVDDLAIVFPHLLGPDPRDPYHVPLGPGAGGPAPRRFCVYPGRAPLDPAIAASLDQAASALTDAGYERVDVTPPRPGTAVDLWMDIIGADLRFAWDQLSAVLGSPARELLHGFTALTRELDVNGLLAANTDRYTLAREWSVFMDDVPLVVTPVSSEQPFPVGYEADLDNLEQLLSHFECLVAVNPLGLPAAVVGTGFAAGRPQSVQLIGPRYRDELCLSAAALIENAYSSACDPRRPPLTAP